MYIVLEVCLFPPLISFGEFNTTGGTGRMFSCEDEPENQFEWGRLSELQRRNTLCLPHLKSSYPVELQACTKKDFDREAQSSIDLARTEPRKRKQNMMTVEPAPFLELPEAPNSKQVGDHFMNLTAKNTMSLWSVI